MNIVHIMLDLLPGEVVADAVPVQKLFWETSPFKRQALPQDFKETLTFQSFTGNVQTLGVIIAMATYLSVVFKQLQLLSLVCLLMFYRQTIIYYKEYKLIVPQTSWTKSTCIESHSWWPWRTSCTGLSRR